MYPRAGLVRNREATSGTQDPDSVLVSPCLALPALTGRKRKGRLGLSPATRSVARSTESHIRDSNPGPALYELEPVHFRRRPHVSDVVRPHPLPPTSVVRRHPPKSTRFQPMGLRSVYEFGLLCDCVVPVSGPQASGAASASTWRQLRPLGPGHLIRARPQSRRRAESRVGRGDGPSSPGTPPRRDVVGNRKPVIELSQS
jgi:hypothetical protein